MTTTDPTITIAGLRAQVESLETSLRAALDDGATSEEVRLIAAAENACLTAERDALAAQLAEVRAELSSDATKRDGRISAICRALDIDDDRDVVDAIDEMRSRHANDLASERAHLAACRTRIAGLEAAANKHRAEIDAAVGQLAAARQVIDERTARVAELEARPVLTEERLTSAVYLSRGIPTDIAAEAAKRILAALGPVTLLPAQDRAEELAAARWAAWRDEAGDTPTTPWDDLRDHRRDSEVRIMKRALRVVGAPPTSPPAVRPVFAGVSVDELARVSADSYDGSGDQIGDADRAAILAVLARLEVSLVAPVDPEAVARAYHDHKDAPAPEWDEVDTWRGRDSDEQSCAIAAMRAVLVKRGLPITPEVGK